MNEALDLFRTIVAAPTFPAAAMERERKKQIHELQNLPNEPRLLPRATMRRLDYGTVTPYGDQEIGLGTTSGVNRITRADTAGFQRSWFNPANSEIVVVGDIGQAQALLAGNLGRWRSAGSQAIVVSVPARNVDPDPGPEPANGRIDCGNQGPSGWRPDAVVWLDIGDRSKWEPDLRKAGIACTVLPVQQSSKVSSADTAWQDLFTLERAVAWPS
jgi:hypothetical protein